MIAAYFLPCMTLSHMKYYIFTDNYFILSGVGHIITGILLVLAGFKAAGRPAVRDSLFLSGEHYFHLGNYSGALNAHMQALRLSEASGNCTEEANSILAVGKMHYYLQQRAEAMRWFSRSLKMGASCQIDSIKVKCLMNMGAIFQETKRIDSALILYHTAEGMLRGTTTGFDSVRKYTLLTNIYCFLAEGWARNKNDKVRGRHYANIAEVTAKLSGQKERIGFAAVKQGIISMLDSNSSEAEIYFQKAYKLFSDVGAADGVLYAMQLSAEAMAHSGKARESHAMMKSIQLLKDSIFKAETADKIARYHTLYETEKKEKANILLEKKNLQAQLIIKDGIRERNQMIVFFVCGIIVLVLTFLVIYNRYRLKKNREINRELAAQQMLRFRSIIETEEKERVRIAREMHDGIGYLLSAARLNISAMTPAGFDDETALNNSMTLIDDAVKEVRTISHNLMPASLTELGMLPAIRELVRKINGSGKILLSLEIEGGEKSLGSSVEIAIYRIVQEIISNMLRHAQAGNIRLMFTFEADSLFISIKDDGIGFNTSMIENSSGIGWKNVFSRVDLLQGKAEVQSTPGSGSTVNLYIPI
ncbi:MAG: tetratricopeptide repeat protein [Sphingobacteriales bacterium]|nr:MAG: tetratricopeptide repeat protein [Sphingobacteriales bacterium]